MAHGCSCGDIHDEGELGIQYNLYTKIDTENIQCLNEYEEGTGATVFKPWEERLNRHKFVESDSDNELLFNVPFTGNVKLKGLIVIGGEDELHPRTVRLFKDRPCMTFDEAMTEPVQEIELYTDNYGVHNYPLKVVKFSSTHYLSLHFVGQSNAEKIKIYYIGLKGEWTPAHRHGVTLCAYEARPQITDHVQESNEISREIT